DQIVMKDQYIGWAHYWLHFSAATAIQNLQVWRFIGCQFIHANLVHLLFNMFMLYMFGRIVEMFLGARRYLGFYLLCGIAGPIGYCGLWAAGWLVSHPVTPLVGASAGVFGVLIAVTVMAPDAQVLVFGLFPAKLREVSFILIFVAVYAVIFWGHSDRGNAGGEAAHLGGAAAGYLLFKHRKLLNIFGRPLATGR
ncbi:MAG: rhomboid family intramembrane serine protease, partial [Desulfobacterales bacterium]|nr:rhomboid family intramembrane serine protease [Desulfobacterales bacterium]